MTTEQKLPDWWDEFCNAVKTRTLDQYECRAKHWADDAPWHVMIDMAGALYLEPRGWLFRKRARTVNINGVELVAPVLAWDVMPRDTTVYGFIPGTLGTKSIYHEDSLVFTSKSDRDAMRAALLGVKP